MASSSQTSTATLLPPDSKPPKSKSASYYSIHSLWQDVEPIPQADQSNALAAISYHPRYSEAMSYLRALMAENEVSERALGLTEDLISMNPAHYTVWIYRMRILRGLWHPNKDDTERVTAKIMEIEVEDEEGPISTPAEDPQKTLWDNINQEIKWLDEVSFRNLKNYQIWHHRHALADLLPPDPLSAPTEDAIIQKLRDFITSEQGFLAQILSLDTKNYHVWSYRQWLCSRYPSFLLPTPYTSRPGPSIAETYTTHPEATAITKMIVEDPYNNSAWSHRYFLLFGHHELSYAQSQNPPLILKQVNEERILHRAGLIDADLVAAEIDFTKSQIRRAPQNGSTWNFLAGVLKHGDVQERTLTGFCEEFLGTDGDLWMDQWVVVEGKRREMGVRSSRAVEWLGGIYGTDGTDTGKERARECFRALSEKWDIIRRAYWGWKLEQLEEEWTSRTNAGTTSI